MGRALRGARQGRSERRRARSSTAASTAKVVRVRDGERIVTDGPFAETKESLGGVFLIDLPDLDEAIRARGARSRRRRDTARSRSGRFCNNDCMQLERRARLPGGVGPCRRDPHPRPRRPRARRGRGAGRVRDRARALAARRRAAHARRLDRHDRPQPRDRPDPPGEGLPAQGRAHRPAPGAARRGGRRERDPRRAARARLHVLPPGARRREPRSR